MSYDLMSHRVKSSQVKSSQVKSSALALGVLRSTVAKFEACSSLNIFEHGALVLFGFPMFDRCDIDYFIGFRWIIVKRL